ncbi:MAG: NAD(P)/FAD-dependent oxidoreductase [Candidatus Omnitrophica bacterium]|nr:NAD(P)/FAD-dependent oxidoreductase [Candidatus Omnitrophota bacterium]
MKSFDLVIVGAGAAGLMTAIAAGRANREGRNILLVDGRRKIGTKILMSGGTRCNVTNVKVSPSDYHGGPSHFIQHVLEAFPPGAAIRFFETIGVKLVLEDTGKYFPATHSGKTVLEALMKETERLSVRLETGVRITRAEKERNGFLLESGGEKIFSKRVALTTGGLSYPETGSDGTGFLLAKSLGHALIPVSPALTPLASEDRDWRTVSGVSLPVKLSFFERGKKRVECEGPFLFTHFGFSGPAALDISRFLARSDRKDAPAIEANFLPGETEESLKKRTEAFQRCHPHKRTKSLLTEAFKLPESFAQVFLKKTGGEPAVSKLIRSLLHFLLPVTGVVGYKKAEVTAGGVDLREVHVSTMESKITPGLYFAGEILDADGRIGGFNFQWCWSTGSLAGQSAIKSLQTS